MRSLDVNKTRDGCKIIIFRSRGWILMNVLVWKEVEVNFMRMIELDYGGIEGKGLIDMRL